MSACRMIQRNDLFPPKWKIQSADLWMYFCQRAYSPKRTGWYKFYPPDAGHYAHYSGMHRRPGKKIVVELEFRFPGQAEPAELEYHNLFRAAIDTRKSARLRFPHFGHEYSTLVEARSFLDKTKYDEFNAEIFFERKQAEITRAKKTLTGLFSEVNDYLVTGAIRRTILGVAAESKSSFLDLSRENAFPFEALGYRAFLTLNKLKKYGIEWNKESELFNLLEHANAKRLQDPELWRNAVQAAKDEREEQWHRESEQFKREWNEYYRNYTSSTYDDLSRRYTRVNRVYFVGVQTLQELKQKRNELAMLHHPDVGGSEDTMKEINAEYSLLESVLP